ncbi:MAG TPA: hypothetical protein PKL97_09235 [Candidatus Omnitrophota bacterium]|nr:hypothetical protein [Candidatus Omnitrophota bacterium]
MTSLIRSIKRRGLRRTASYSIGVILVIAVALAVAHRFLLKTLIEYNLNRSAGEVFMHSLRIGSVRLDRDFRIRIDSLTGFLYTDAETVPVEIQTLHSEDPVWNLFRESGLSLIATGIRFKNSRRQKIGATLWLRGGFRPESVLRIDLKKLELDEIYWIDPADLSGLTGRLEGKLILKNPSPETFSLKLKLKVNAPGGHIKAGTFEPLLPYLPESLQREYVKELTENPFLLIHYDDAAFELDLTESDRMKIFLHMTVPDYNLVLNLNVELKLDEENAFLRLLELLSLMNAKGQT